MNQDEKLTQGRRSTQADRNARITVLCFLFLFWFIVGLLIWNSCSAQRYNVVIDHNRNGVKHTILKNISSDSASVVIGKYMPGFDVSRVKYTELSVITGELLYVQQAALKSKKQKSKPKQK